MKRFSTALRLSIGLASITMIILFVAHQIGLVPDAARSQMQNRAKLCEAIAVQFSIAVQKNQIEMIKTSASLITGRNPDILSIAITNAKGDSLVETNDHESLWQTMPQEQSTATHIQIPLFRGDRPWGNIQICFHPIAFRGLVGLWNRTEIRLALFLAFLAVPCYWLYLRRTFRYLDPSKVIPDRVKAILDTLSEGVLVLDNDEQIVLANEAFIKTTSRTAAELQGRKVSDIPWTQLESDKSAADLPWKQAIEKGQPQKSIPLTLQSDSNETHTFVVNSSPIRGTDRKPRGVLATFDDVSEIEEKNTKLEKTLQMLKESRNKIKQQNDELKLLSMRDPLTGCLNRRAFFEKFETAWSGAARYDYTLGCVMIDIDHFKSINDNHGHAVGDQVLQKVASVLTLAVRKSDSLCRYGGEEFCVLLPHTNISNTYKAAEKYRRQIEASLPANILITASFGVSAHELQAGSCQELIDQADKALYAAKNNGRNRVVRWDQMPDKVQVEKSQEGPAQKPKETEPLVSIPFSAVTALMSALEHRDVATALHSRNVADLCVAMAKGLISESECFILEVAGLLHDIGKLGVPDSILLKPGPLTDQEWKVMETHDRMGVEIINASFGSAELTNIVRYSHAWYGGSPRDPGLPKGRDIPLRSRMVLIADAYDAMTSDRVYRKAKSQQEAIAELRHCAGKQFDPELLERFIEAVLARDQNRNVKPLAESRAKALRIGLEIERLACAMEAQDISMLTAITGHLIANATKLGLPEIADYAGKLKQATTTDKDPVKLMEYTTELLELCRSHQSSYLATLDADSR